MAKGNSSPLVIVTHALPDGWLSLIEDSCHLVVGPADTTGFSDELRARLPEAQGLFTLLTDAVDEDLLKLAPNLKVVSNMAVGVDNIDIPACTRRGIPVGHTPGVLTEGTADLTLALLLASARRLPDASADAKAGRWTTWSPTGWLGADLNNATLGILGMGKIGQAVAVRSAGFGLHIIYTDPQPRPEIEKSTRAKRVSFDELLETSDFLTIHVPLNDQTRGMIGAQALKAMKPSAILVNIARGPVVDTNALLEALRQGWIASAALDVTDPEPLPPEHPLYQLPNCLIVPHIGSATYGTRKQMAELACKNLLAGLETRELPSCINPEVYD